MDKKQITIKIKVGGKKIAKGILFIVLGALVLYGIGYFVFVGTL